MYVMTPVVAPAAATNGGAYASLLTKKAAVTRYASKGVAFIRNLFNRLGLGRLTSTLSGTWSWLSSKLGFLTKVKDFVGSKTLLTLAATTGVGRAVISKVASIIAWPIKKAYNLTVLLLDKIGMAGMLTTPVNAAAKLVTKVKTFLAPHLSLDSPLVTSVRGFISTKVTWALSRLAFIPGPIGLAIRVVSGISMVLALAGQVARFFGSEAKWEQIQEQFMSKLESENIVTEHVQADGSTVRVTEIKDPAKEGLVATGEVHVLDDGTEVPIYTDAPETPKLHLDDMIDKAKQAAAVLPATEVAESLQALEDEKLVRAFLANNGPEATARAVLAEAIPAVPKVMSKNEAKETIRKVELARRAARKTDK